MANLIPKKRKKEINIPCPGCRQLVHIQSDFLSQLV